MLDVVFFQGPYRTAEDYYATYRLRNTRYYNDEYELEKTVPYTRSSPGYVRSDRFRPGQYRRDIHFIHEEESRNRKIFVEIIDRDTGQVVITTEEIFCAALVIWKIK